MVKAGDISLLTTTLNVRGFSSPFEIKNKKFYSPFPKFDML